ncbi:MAG: NDP-sugar synthase [Thermoanaerobaculia bacterium]
MTARAAELDIRAVVLCAGLGMRLRPLTARLPKPLLPAVGRPVLEHTLAELRSLGCTSVAINLHHLPQTIRKRFGSAWQGMGITYSEEPEILGTLGALGPLRDFVAGGDLVLVVNGDSLCRWPLKRLVRLHLKSRADASLLVSRRARPERFGGGVLVGEDGRILALRGGREARKKEHRRVFAGAHVFSPALLDRAAKPVAGEPGDFVTDLWEPLLTVDARLQAVETKRRWHDLGTPRRYLEAVLDTARGRWPGRLWRRRWIAGGARAEPGSRVKGSVLESGARAERGARVVGSVLLPGAVAGRGCEVDGTILGPEVDLPPGASIKARMVTVSRSDVQLPEGGSFVGGLVYTKLEAAPK